MTNTEHMELARLCAEWESAAANFDCSSKESARIRARVYRMCRRELEAILNAATITPDPKEEVVE